MQSILALIKSLFNRILTFLRLRGVGPVIIEDPDAPGTEEPSRVDPGEVVCYYGCPNSNKARKLQLDKKAYR